MARRVAMIDDSLVELAWLKRHLARHGYEIVTHSMSLGIQAFVTQHNPDVILLDVNMPALSGDTLCKMLKDNPHTRNVPVFLYSSLSAERLQALTEECGADGFIVKNHDVASLLEQLERALSR